jgi:hypothetical protein
MIRIRSCCLCGGWMPPWPCRSLIMAVTVVVVRCTFLDGRCWVGEDAICRATSSNCGIVHMFLFDGCRGSSSHNSRRTIVTYNGSRCRNGGTMGGGTVIVGPCCWRTGSPWFPPTVRSDISRHCRRRIRRRIRITTIHTRTLCTSTSNNMIIIIIIIGR